MGKNVRPPHKIIYSHVRTLGALLLARWDCGKFAELIGTAVDVPTAAFVILSSSSLSAGCMTLSMDLCKTLQ